MTSVCWRATLCTLILAGGLACSPPEPPAEPVDIVLLLVNELRADPPGERGAEHALLRGLGRKPALRFEAAYTQSVDKHVALGALMTGRYPSAIPLCGVPHGASVEELPPCSTLPEDMTTLPEVLELYGYHTALFSTDLSRAEQLAADFDVVVDFSQGGGQAERWAALEAAAAEWWEDQDSEPRLLVISSSVENSVLRDGYRAAIDRYPYSATELEDWRERADPKAVVRVLDYPSWPLASERAIRQIRELYEQVAEAHGERSRRLIHMLEHGADDAREPSRPLWTIVTSLRGLSLGEYEGTQSPEQSSPGTTLLLMDRNVRVPLVIAPPDGVLRTRGVEHPVQIVDLLPTVCRMVGAVPPAGAVGHDLFSQATTPPDEASAYMEFGDMLALRKGPYLLRFRFQRHGMSSIDPRLTEWLIQQDLGSQLGRGPSYMLHDVVADPFERYELGPRRMETLLALRDRLIWIRTHEGAPPSSLLEDQGMESFLQRKAMHYW